ncbi:unnamed protein product [Auanema sp. JU1783]|nr:unnamed protein product [Auanema sp. JU1783]
MARDRTPPSTTTNKLKTSTMPVLQMRPKRGVLDDYTVFVNTEKRKLLTADPKMDPTELALKIARKYKMLCDRKNTTFTNYRIGKAQPPKRFVDENMHSSGGGFSSPVEHNAENTDTNRKRSNRDSSCGVSANVAAALGISMSDCKPQVESKVSNSPRSEVYTRPTPKALSAIKGVSLPQASVLRKIDYNKNIIKTEGEASKVTLRTGDNKLEKTPAKTPTLSKMENLQMFYLACCEPAFPPTGYVPDMTHSANFYYDCYTGMKSKELQSRL